MFIYIFQLPRREGGEYFGALAVDVTAAILLSWTIISPGIKVYLFPFFNFCLSLKFSGFPFITAHRRLSWLSIGLLCLTNTHGLKINEEKVLLL